MPRSCGAPQQRRQRLLSRNADELHVLQQQHFGACARLAASGCSARATLLLPAPQVEAAVIRRCDACSCSLWLSAAATQRVSPVPVVRQRHAARLLGQEGHHRVVLAQLLVTVHDHVLGPPAGGTRHQASGGGGGLLYWGTGGGAPFACWESLCLAWQNCCAGMVSAAGAVVHVHQQEEGWCVAGGQVQAAHQQSWLHLRS